MFSQKISFYSSLLFSLFPLHIYSCGQISSISLQVFLTTLFFYFFFRLIEKRNFFQIFFLSLISGLLILLRGEFIVIIFFSFMYLLIFFKISFKKFLLIFLITLITISPYLLRNVNIFKTITITKTFGYNLWKGNNLNSNVEQRVLTVVGSVLDDSPHCHVHHQSDPLRQPEVQPLD